MHSHYDDEALRQLAPDDRENLARRLRDIMSELDEGPSGSHAARELFVTVTAFSSFFLGIWVLVLAALLPATHSVTYWRQTWIGFDIVLALLLLSTAILAFLRRQAVVLTAFITGTLLVCDAWFDVMTAAPGWDRAGSLGSAVIELALAAICYNTVRLFLHFTTGSPSDMAPGQTNPPRSFLTATLEGHGLRSDLGRLSMRRAINQVRAGRTDAANQHK